MTASNFEETTAERETLAEVLDRLLAEGIVADAHLVITLADVPLVRLSARLVAATAFRLDGSDERRH